MKNTLLALWRIKYVKLTAYVCLACLLSLRAFDFALGLKGSALPVQRQTIESASLQNGTMLSLCWNEGPRLSNIALFPAELSHVVIDASDKPWAEIRSRHYLFFGGTMTESVTLHLRSEADLKIINEQVQQQQMLAANR